MTTLQRPPGVDRAGRATWSVPVALVLLSVVPVVAGALRLVQLAGGPQVLPPDPRFAGLPLPLVIHILGATTYAVFGSLQFAPRFRRRHWAWHRRAGRVLAVAGLCVAGSALWMTLAYGQKPGTGDVLFVLRLVFASAMAGCLVLGVAAAWRHDIPAHRAWMVRAYAIALAAGTQAFTEGIGGAVFGTGELRGDLAKGAGWVVNLVIAEWAIRGAPRLSLDPPICGVASVTSRVRWQGPGANGRLDVFRAPATPPAPRTVARSRRKSVDPGSAQLRTQPVEVTQHPRAREQSVPCGEERDTGVLEAPPGGREA